MTGSDAPAGVQLDEATAEFVTGTTSMSVATRSADLVPSLAKAVGCTVSADRRWMTVFVDREQATQIAADIAAGSPIAVVFSLPATHRTVQVKGAAVAAAPATATQQVRAAMHVDAIVEHLVQLGYREGALRSFFGFDPDRLLALRFAPTAVFAQTPGPRAGERIAG